jgi:hypothetical protein
MKHKKRHQNKPSSVSIRGFVELLDTGYEDIPFDAVLVTDDGEELYVETPGRKNRLSDFADTYVQVSGSIFEREWGTVISAKRIVAVDELEEEPYDEFESDSDGYDDSYGDNEDIQEFMRGFTRAGSMKFF